MNRDCTPRARTIAPLSIDRRTLIVGVASLPLLPPSIAMADTTATPFSDAHAHFFNASDLPIGGFAKYDLMPEWLGNNPAVAAIVDLLANLIKPRAKTAEWEAEHLGETEEWGWQAFAREAAHFVLGRKSAPAKQLADQGVSQAQLSASYEALRTALMADANYRIEAAPQMLRKGADERELNERIFGEVARKVDDSGAWGPGDVADYNAAANAQVLAPNMASVLGVIARAVGWAYLMTKRRETHLKEYVGRNGAAGFAPDLLVNHLVDYDLWVADHPADGSSHVQQVEFWNKLAGTAKSWPRPVDVRTFAGFCPLKLAVQTRGHQHRTFDDLKRLRREGKIAGFKLYPPMGFQPIGNVDVNDSEFDPGGILRVSALDQWRTVASNHEPLGPKLDEALGEFYDYCVVNRVPIMAHARRSNGTAPTYEARANPLFWKQVVDRWPIRLQLGHLITGAKKFVEQKTSSGEDDAWPLEPRVAMLTNPNFDSGAQVYGDLGYMQDLLGEPGLAASFFIKLREIFGEVGLKRISYGTDWIMLQREKHQQQYLSTLIAGMTGARYSPEQMADVLENNVRRFLGG